MERNVLVVDKKAWRAVVALIVSQGFPQLRWIEFGADSGLSSRRTCRAETFQVKNRLLRGYRQNKETQVQMG